MGTQRMVLLVDGAPSIIKPGYSSKLGKKFSRQSKVALLHPRTLGKQGNFPIDVVP